MSELKRKAIRGVRWTALSAGFLAIGGFVQTLLFPRLLDVADFSLMAIINVILGLSIQLIDMGFSNAIMREQAITPTRLSSFYWVNVGIGLFLALLLWTTAPYIAAAFPKLDADKLIPMVHWLAPCFILNGLSAQYVALLQKQLRFKALSVIEMISFAAGFMTALGAAYSGYGPISLVSGAVVRMGISTLLLIALGLHHHRPQLHFAWEDIRPSWKFGAYQSLEKTVAYLAVNFDTLLITRWLSPEISGVYEVVKRLLIQPWYFINPVVTKVIYPVMAQVHAETDRLRNIALRGIQLVAAINVPIYIGCAIGAGLMVPVLFGTKYVSEGVMPFRLLALAFMVRAIFNPLGSVILAKGNGQLSFMLQAGAFAGQVIAVSIGAYFGLNGTLIALLIFNLFIVVVTYFAVAKPLIQASPGSLLAQFVPEILLSVLTFGGAWAIARMMGGGLSAFWVFLSIGGICYLTGLLWWRRNLIKDVKAMVPKWNKPT